MEHTQEESPARHQSNIRNILEQVKSGVKNKSEAFSELRGILNSSAGKGLGAFSRGEEADVEEEQPQYYGNGSANGSGNGLGNVPNQGRFSQEDRRMLINKLIEKKRRNEEENIDSENIAENIPYSEQEGEGDYQYDNEYQGEEENKWENNPSNNQNNQNNGSDDLRYSYEGDREEKGMRILIRSFTFICLG